jgi:hypothetical protein
MFKDTTIDIQTSTLLGRYVAEERDSGRMLSGCYNELCLRESGDTLSPSVAAGLEARLDRMEGLLEKVCETLTAKEKSSSKR